MSDRIGNYDLIHHLATGGMAEVWVGKHADDPNGRSYAIKRILPHLAREEKFVEMFLDEARIASQLDHPNIVEIDELGESDGEYYIAMEYIEGADLAEVLDLAERWRYDIPIGVAIRIAIDVLDALGYAHDFKDGDKPLDIVHRDVSPHNVLVSHEGEVRLVDFGVAKAVERHSKTETGFVKGKLSYMSPEQIRQDPVDRRSDIFAIGVVLYELLTKDTPFGRELSAVNAILTKPPKDPSKKRKDLPKELVRIILKALEKDENERYKNAREMSADLKNLRDTKYAGVDKSSIGMMLADLHDLQMSETLEYTAMRTNLDDDEVDPEETTVKAPTDEIALAAAQEPKKRKAPIFIGIAILVLGIAGGAFALIDKSDPEVEPVNVSEVSTTEEPENVAASAISKSVEVAEANIVQPKENIPNPFEEADPATDAPGGEDGFYFVLEDGEEIAEGDEVVLELDDEEIAQVIRYRFDRTAEDQHADFFLQRTLAEFATTEDAKLDPSDPKFDISFLSYEDPSPASTVKKPTPKKPKVSNKKKKSKKKRVVRRKRSKSKKKPVVKVKKRRKSKTEMIDKAIPGGF